MTRLQFTRTQAIVCVILDVDSTIGLARLAISLTGADFAQELLGHVRSAHVLLAVIGPRWLTAADPATGQRRIDDPE